MKSYANSIDTVNNKYVELIAKNKLISTFSHTSD